MARQSLGEGWQETHTASLAKTSIKYATIVMAYIGARTVHFTLRTLRAHALRIRTGTHDQGLATVNNDIPISNTSLFGGDLSKVVAKAPPASQNYKALVDCFILSGLSWSKHPKRSKQKVSTLPPFCGRSQSGN